MQFPELAGVKVDAKGKLVKEGKGKENENTKKTKKAPTKKFRARLHSLAQDIADLQTAVDA